jgi:DNA-binding transcriptional LysR family regulator
MITLEKISLKRMQYFQEVVKQQSITGAARILRMPISTLDREIMLLEKALGTSLRAKDKKKLTLTEDGIKFTKYSAESLNRFYDYNFGGVENKIAEITISSTHGICELYIPKVVQMFSEQYPDIRVNINAGEQFLQLNTNYSDIVIGPNIPNRPDLSQIFIKEFKYYMFSTQEYLEKHHKDIEPKNNHNLILHDENIDKYIEKFPNSKCIATSNSYRTLIELGKLGMGIFPITMQGIKHFTNDFENFKVIFDDPCETENVYFIKFKHSNKMMLVNKIKSIIDEIFRED